MANAFLTDLENIGKHILSGIEKAAPVVGKILTAAGPVVPVVGPILTEVGTIITNLEKSSGSALTAAEIEQIVQVIVTAAQIKTAASTAAASSGGTAS